MALRMAMPVCWRSSTLVQTNITTTSEWITMTYLTFMGLFLLTFVIHWLSSNAAKRLTFQAFIGIPRKPLDRLPGNVLGNFSSALAVHCVYYNSTHGKHYSLPAKHQQVNTAVQSIAVPKYRLTESLGDSLSCLNVTSLYTNENPWNETHWEGRKFGWPAHSPYSHQGHNLWSSRHGFVLRGHKPKGTCSYVHVAYDLLFSCILGDINVALSLLVTITYLARAWPDERFLSPRTLSLWTTVSRTPCRPCTDLSMPPLSRSCGSSSVWWKGSTEETASAASLTSCYLPRGSCRSFNKKPVWVVVAPEVKSRNPLMPSEIYLRIHLELQCSQRFTCY